MRSLSCCSKTSFSCLAEKISSLECNPAGAMKQHYQLCTETSSDLGTWDTRGSVVCGLFHSKSCVIKVPTTGNTLPLKGVSMDSAGIVYLKRC